MWFVNRKRNRLSRLRVVVTCGFLLTSWASAARALALPSLSLSPSASTLQVGNLFTLDLNIAGAADVYGWQVDVSFDSSVISVLGTSEGMFLTSGGFTTFFINGTLDNGTGLVDDMAATRTGPVTGANGAGLLATLTFQAVGAGVSPLTIGNVVLSDSSAGSLAVGTLTGASATVAPEPATLMLLAWGLSGLAALGRLRGRARR